MTTDYKFAAATLAARFEVITAQLGNKPMLATFVESTRKIVAVRGGYLRFGPYWWAVKAILKNNGVDLGGEDSTWLRGEYSIKSAKGVVDQESTLIAAWLFADGNSFSPSAEWEIDGTVWLIDDADMT